MMRLHAQLVHTHIVARCHGPHAVEYAFRASLARNGVDDNVGLGQRAVHGVSGRLHQLPGVLKREAPRQGQRKVGEVSRAGAPHTRLLHRHHALHLLHFADQASPCFRRHFVHQHSHGLAAQHEREPQNHDRNHNRGKRVSVFEPADSVMRARPSWRPTRQALQEWPRCRWQNEMRRWPARASL